MRIHLKRLFLAVLISTTPLGLSRADLAERIDAIIKQPSQKKVDFSIHIVKADTGKTLYRHNANNALIPASNMKIIVTAAALKYLGPDYEYKTRVALADNTLVVIGSGDPLLGDKVTDAKHNRPDGWVLDEIVAALKQNGKTSIKDIVVDTTVFDDQRVHPNWPKHELNRWYASEVCGLNYNCNCVTITAKNTGHTVNVLLEPSTNYIRLVNKIRPIKNGTGAVGAYRNHQPNTIILKGKCKTQQGPFLVAIERPAAFFGFLLAEKLAKEGITVRGHLVEKSVRFDAGLQTLAVFSTSIADCLDRCNKDSLQLAAESLLKTIAANSLPDKKNGSWALGRQLLSNYLLQLGIDQSQFHIDDGSGLSRQNRLSANAITKVLTNVYNSDDWTLYKDSLAVGGGDGTIRKYFRQPQYKGKICGKTGYINGVKSFSGFCTTADGDYAFSILANNANGKTRLCINDIAKAIIDTAGK